MMAKPSKDYESGLLARLKDPGYAAEYLNEVLSDPESEGAEERFLIALADVAKAFGITNVSEKAQVSRQHVYTLLSEHGNPSLYTLNAILESVGLRLQVQPLQLAS